MDLIWTLQSIDLNAILDITLVAVLIFVATYFVRGTQSMPMLRGVILVIIFLGIFSSVTSLTAISWVLRNVLTATAVAIPIIFQPELRRAFERVGRYSLRFRENTLTQREAVIDAICQAAGRLSERRHGALIVLERGDNLEEFANSGVMIDGELTPQILLTIFWPKTELHDGAIIVRSNRVLAAACVLPLTSSHNITGRKMGTRHRASLGMSEVSDAVVVAVSEETGQISVSTRGRMIRQLDQKRLATILATFYSSESDDEQPQTPFTERLRRFLRFPTDKRGDAAA